MTDFISTQARQQVPSRPPIAPRAMWKIYAGSEPNRPIVEQETAVRAARGSHRHLTGRAELTAGRSGLDNGSYGIQDRGKRDAELRETPRGRASVRKMRQMNTVRVLQSVAIFAETPIEALEDIADILEEIKFNAGETIFVEDEWGTSTYIIIEGRVRVHKEGRTLTELGRSNVFGEMAALTHEPRSASVTAMEDTRLFCLTQEQLFRLCQVHPDVFYGIACNLSRQLKGSTYNLAQDHLYIEQVNHIIEAALDLERGIYEPKTLESVVQRTDELGQLARVFQEMVHKVHLREQQLRQEVYQLRIEVDDAKSQQQVQQIVETDFFHELQIRAHELRRSRNK